MNKETIDIKEEVYIKPKLEVDYKIVITGILCLTAIYITLAILGRDDSTISSLIIGIIALAIGVIIPSPLIDNKRGVLKW
jgi:hypothetical protein